MDLHCIYYHKPLLDSGTLSTKGNVVVVVSAVVVVVVVPVVCSSILCGRVCTWTDGVCTTTSVCWSPECSALRAM